MTGWLHQSQAWLHRACCTTGLLFSASTGLYAEESHPLEPTEALKSFVLEDGLELELVASEPAIVDPVAITFDHLGRMYVAEYRDYPLGPPEGEQPLSEIKLLEDVDKDGTYEKATLFAKVPWAQGVLAHGKGLIVTASPQVLYLEDTDGDGKADHQEVLLSGFTFGNPQLRVGHPRRGLDQRIYLTNGLTGGKVTVGPAESATGEPLTMGRNDLVYDPAAKTIDLVPGQAQFGNTFDDFGNRFFCTNRNPIIYAPLSQRTMTRNPLAPALVAQEDVAPSGGASRVYSLIEGKTTAVSHAGTHTAACGTHVYRGSNLGYPELGLSNVFVCEPTGSLVTRTILKPQGTSFQSSRPYERRDFLTSHDPWFRPVSLADGPDGNLYVVDMYREVIEHPQYMPPGLAETLRLRAGDDRGRIYRIRRKSAPKSAWTPYSSREEQLKGLQESNGWRRDLAQRLLLQEATKENAPALAVELKKLLGHQDPRVVTQAIWTLAGLNRQQLLEASELQSATTQLLGHADPIVVEQAIRVIEFAKLDTAGLAQIQLKDPRFNARLALNWIDAMALVTNLDVQTEIGQLIAKFAKDQWIRQIALTLPAETSAPLLCQLLKSDSFLNEGGEPERELVTYLATIVGKRAKSAEVSTVLTEVLSRQVDHLPWWRSSILFGLDQGLASSPGIEGKKRLSQLASGKDAELAALAKKSQDVLAAGLPTLTDAKSPPLNRRAAVPVLSGIEVDQAIPVIRTLLSSDAEPAIQRAAYGLVNGRAPDKVLQEMLASWKDFGPASRSLIIEMALARPTTSIALMKAMEAGTVSPSLLTIEQRDPLLMTRNPEMLDLAKKLFGQATNQDRAAVIAKYQPALTLKGDATRGKEVFRRVCAQCHKIGDEGTLVGPDLSDIRAKGNETLLSDILDPSRAIEPRWASYVAVMEDGRVITGLLVRENAGGIVLRKAKGIEDNLPRAEIEVLRPNEQSLMPAGIEADVTVEQMADLLAFLKGGR